MERIPGYWRLYPYLARSRTAFRTQPLGRDRQTSHRRGSKKAQKRGRRGVGSKEKAKKGATKLHISNEITGESCDVQNSLIPLAACIGSVRGDGWVSALRVRLSVAATDADNFRLIFILFDACGHLPCCSERGQLEPRLSDLCVTIDGYARSPAPGACDVARPILLMQVGVTDNSRL